MLNKLITNLKNSLSKKKGDESSEEDSPEEIDSTDTESKDNSGDDASKKKRSMIIKVVVVLGIAYLALDQFVLKQDDNQLPNTAASAKPKRKRVKKDGEDPAAQAPNPQAQTAGTPVDPNVVNPADKANPKNDTTTLPPTENANVTSKTEVPAANDTVTSSTIVNPAEDVNPSKAIDQIVEKAPEVEEKKPVEKKPEEKKPVVEEKALSLGETKQKEKQLDKDLDKLIDGTEPVKKEEKPAIDLKDKIAVEETYVEPPPYDNPGRGLVYNCKDKYWVCVDKPSYVQCNKNMKYNKSHSRPTECAVSNVYSTIEDCGLIQKYNVSHNTSTEFCN